MMSREEVFKATGPTSGSSMTVKIGVKKDGKIAAADGLFKFQAGAFPGSPVMNALHVRLRALRHRERAHGRLRRGVQPAEVAAYRAPGSPISAFAVESMLDVLAQKIGMDPLQLRLKNAAKPGTQMRVRREARRTPASPRRFRRCTKHPGYNEAARQEPGARHGLGLLVQRRRRVERDGARERGRHGRGRDRQPGHRRLARLDGA